MSSVFVLGAGASKHVGYPLIATMGSELLVWMSAQDMFRGTEEFLRKQFGASPNVEDVVTELDCQIELGNDASAQVLQQDRTTCANVLGKIRTAIPMWFREIRNNPAPAYATFADHIVRPGDTVVSFNYDDSLEHELRRTGIWDVCRGYGFSAVNGECASQVKVLKLHGSINWFVSIGGGITSGYFMIGPDGMLDHSPHLASDDLRFLGYAEMNGTFPGGGALPSLILPGRTKEFYYADNFGKQHEDFFNSLWAQAADALGRADRIVLCGYGMAAADKRACDLLLGSTDKSASIEIVCGSASQALSSRFRSAGFANVSYFDGFFEAWAKAPSLQCPDARSSPV